MTATIEDALQEYFDGLHHGDTDRLQPGLPPAGDLRLGDRRRARPPHDGGVLPDRRRTTVARLPPRDPPRPSRVHRIRSARSPPSPASSARSEPKRFDDVLTLVRIDDRWQIIAKVFHYELAEES